MEMFESAEYFKMNTRQSTKRIIWELSVARNLAQATAPETGIRNKTEKKPVTPDV